MTQSSNPLQQFFRQPVLYLNLPSQGEYWPSGSIEIPPNQELPVLPMTAIDEITYRTPDALFNGAAVVNVIESCIPGIKNAWAAPAMDINSILVAIRIASFGRELEITSQCPSCETENDYGMDLHGLLGQLETPDFSKNITQGDLDIYFRPIDYKTQNEIGMQQFEQQRILAQLPSAELPEDQKMTMVKDAMLVIAQLTTKAITASIFSIKTPGGIVTEKAFIEEFLNNCDRRLYTEIKDHVIGLKQQSDIPPMKVTCNNCSHHYEQGITLDQTNFFGTAS
jgi:hypothetical protein